jgi:hypothetical protein
VSSADSRTQSAPISVTRALKNARFLQRVVPAIIPAEEPPEGFGSIVPLETLARLHRVREPAALLTNPAHRAALKHVRFPQVTSALADPMFNGTVYLTRITFVDTNPLSREAPAAVSKADMQTARAFLSLAAPRISAYASQYGGNRIDVSPRILEFTAPTTFSFFAYRYWDSLLQAWVNEIASQNGLSGSDCVVVLNPPGAVNSDAPLSLGVGGYHWYANLAYAFVNVVNGGLTIADTDQSYAQALSHEIAETTVDPGTDFKNPEVCDPCGPNCQNVFIDYFDDNGAYIQTVQAPSWPPPPPPFSYSFCINGIVKPTSATACPAPSAACVYAPPINLSPVLYLLRPLPTTLQT